MRGLLFFVNRDKKSGFTLVELLVVMSIIGILASVVLASLNGTRAKGRDSRRISDLKQIQLALSLHYDQNNYFPVALSDLAPSFINPVPKDPSTSNNYDYYRTDGEWGASMDACSSNCAGYILRATLENNAAAAYTNALPSSQYANDTIDCRNPSGSASTLYYCVSQ